MGSLAVRETEPNEGEDVQGIMVTHNFHSKIVSPEDLATYTPLRVGSISSKLHVPYAGSIETLRLFLTEMFMGVTETLDEMEGETKFGLHENQVSSTNYFSLYLVSQQVFLSNLTKNHLHYPIMFSCLIQGDYIVWEEQGCCNR